MTTRATDSEILRLLKAQDPNALSDVVSDNSGPLYRAILSMGINGDDAEDLLQDVFMTFLATLGRLEERSRVRTLLFAVLYKKVFETRRERDLADQYDPIDEIVESWFSPDGAWIKPPADIERVIGLQEAAVHLRACVDSLPPLQKAVFELREREELSSTEVCEALGISPSNFGVLMHRARMKLRVCLIARGIHQ